MIVSAHANHIKFPDEEETELTDIWEDKAQFNTLFWSRKDDEIDRKNEKRNYKIKQIRDKHLAEKKLGPDYYEKHSQCTYRSFEDRNKFFKEIEESELCLKAEPITTFQDKLDILYCDPSEKRGRDPVTNDDPDIYYSFKDLNRCQKEVLEDEL